MEITMIVNGSAAVHRGAALPTLGLSLRPRVGSADGPVASFIGGFRGSAITPTPAPTLDVTSARTS
jgi:hypothetical protein